MPIVRSAEKIKGWMSRPELEWLSAAAAKRRRIIEVGSWKGRSTKAISLSTPGVVYAVDHWKGALLGREGTTKEVLERGSAAVYADFQKNLAPQIATGKVVVIRAESKEAVPQALAFLGGQRADMVFIDASHDYASVKRDLALWAPVVEAGGLFCGHDYNPFWPGVVRAVNEAFATRGILRKGNGSIWFAKLPKEGA